MEQSTEKLNALVDRVFARFSVMYGNNFVKMWEGIDPAEVRKCWADELAKYDLAQIVLAVGKLKEHTFPPTLPEFLQMCDQARQRLPAELEKRPRLPSPVAMASHETVAARERFMALRATLKRPPMTPAWAYKAYERHQSGEHLLNPEELKLCVDAMAEDRGRHAPQQQKEAA